MAQVRVNGAVSSDQFLTGSLSHFIVDEVDGAANVALFGFDGSGDPNPGEEIVQLISTIVNPVIVESANARVMYFAAEVDGHSATDIANVINASATFANATVTEGSYVVA